MRATIAQVDELSRYGATINTFMLGEDAGLRRFVDAMARRAGGRVFTPDIGRLGEYVVADYLHARVVAALSEPSWRRDAGPVDLAILGGGLAGGLVALALTLRRPELRLAVVEEGTVGGNHVWSSFARDVDPRRRVAGRAADQLPLARYDVAFPAHRRTLSAPYRSITSERFAARAGRAGARRASFIRGRVSAAEPGRVRAERRAPRSGPPRSWTPAVRATPARSIWAGRSSSGRRCTPRRRTGWSGRW